MSLNQKEHEAMVITTELPDAFVTIIGNGHTRNDDIREFVHHLHAIQHMILAQSACREYPDKYRLLGKTL